MCPYKNPEDARTHAKRYYQEHREQILARKRKHPKNPVKQREASQRYYRKHRDKVKSRCRKYYRRHREERLAYYRAYHLINEEKIFAWNQGKKIPLGPECEICGATDGLERHHPDYSKPLEIMTVCRSCHLTIHRVKNL